MVYLRRPVTFVPLFIMLPFLTFGDLDLPKDHILAQHEMRLDNRHEDPWVNEVFKDNILLNLAYLRDPNIPNPPNWDQVRKSFQYQFILDPNRTFTFHDDILEKYQGKVVHTNAHFNFKEGFRSSGYLFGDGVCHLASLIYWVAKDADLEAEAPTNHDFRNIPDIPKEFGVSIYANPFNKGANTRQNLYITNNKSEPIIFKFEYDGDKIKVSVVELNKNL
ncbi:VanW family protein [Candidatus Daviesbacteria bacterium]|nr:VanW family protein [Candidatus Daviesbacteria bacterium]